MDCGFITKSVNYGPDFEKVTDQQKVIIIVVKIYV